MDARVEQLMVPRVIVARVDETIGAIRRKMRQHRIHAIPVLDEQHRPAGIITSSDLVEEVDSGRQVAEIMTRNIYSVSKEDGAHVAARLMRNRRVHHLLVTEGPEVVGILSSFDLLRLVEQHRFVRKDRHRPAAAG